MQIIYSSACSLSPGHFGAAVIHSELHVPIELMQLLSSKMLDTAEAFLMYLHYCPAYFKKGLKWGNPELDGAKQLLIEALRPHLDVENLLSFDVPPVGFGLITE